MTDQGSRQKKLSKFKYSNKFFEDTARHLSKSEIAMWTCLWNYAMPKGERLVAEVSAKTLGEYLRIKRSNVSTVKTHLKKKGLLRNVGIGANRVEMLEVYPVMRPAKSQTGRYE